MAACGGPTRCFYRHAFERWHRIARVVLPWPMLINWFDYADFDAWEIAARRRHLARPLKGGDSVEAPGVPGSSRATARPLSHRSRIQ